MEDLQTQLTNEKLMNTKFVDLIKKQDFLIKEQQSQIDQLSKELRESQALNDKLLQNQNKMSLTTSESEIEKVKELTTGCLNLKL